MVRILTDSNEIRTEIERRRAIITSQWDSSTAPGGLLKIYDSMTGGQAVYEVNFGDYSFPEAPAVSPELVNPANDLFKNFKKVQVFAESIERNGVVFFGFKNKVFPKITIELWVGLRFTFSQAKITDTYVFGSSILTKITFDKYSVELPTGV